MIVVGAIAARAGLARAQSVEASRFFVDKEDDDDDKTLWQGSLTSSTFLFRESGGKATALVTGGAQVDNASPFSRLFTDLRAQLDARHVKGGRWDGRVDARARVTNGEPNETGTQTNQLQSGTFGGSEYELKELFAVHSGHRTDVFVGRQLIGDLGAVKIDGLRIDYASTARWTYLGFAGLYPLRGSRSLTTDYPTVTSASGGSKRVLPIAGGFGAAYRTQRTYGAIGGVAIVTPQRDRDGSMEKPRVFVTANGYARRSPTFDIYHYFVVDLYGSAGFALTNATVGVQWKPAPRLRTNLSANRVDAEVLNVQVRDQLENVTPLDGVALNNVIAQRIASDSVRGTVSAGLGNTNRFELTTGLTGRRRPAITLDTGTTTVPLSAAQAVEFMVQAVDRRFYGGVRLDLSYIHTFGVGGASLGHAKAQIVRLGGRKEYRDGKAELAGDLSYVQTADDSAGMPCTIGNHLSCYGDANTTSLTATGVGYYRLKQNWFANASLGVGSQKITITNPMGTGGGVPQSTTVSTSVFLRIGYRF